VIQRQQFRQIGRRARHQKHNRRARTGTRCEKCCRQRNIRNGADINDSAKHGNREQTQQCIPAQVVRHPVLWDNRHQQRGEQNPNQQIKTDAWPQISETPAHTAPYSLI